VPPRQAQRKLRRKRGAPCGRAEIRSQKARKPEVALLSSGF
jgi:hypothetical protein